MNPRAKLTNFGIACLTLISSFALAQERDPAAARELLKQGYELKVQKNWTEAIAKLSESARLDPQPKTLINLAECEEAVDKLVDAQRHLVEARNASQADEELRNLAEARLSAVEKRMPRLVVRLRPGAPSGTVVTRNGVTLNAPSLGVALPTDPGKQTVTARAPGYAERTFTLEVAERETKEMEVAPGEQLPPPPEPPPTAVPQPAPVPPAPEQSSSPLPFIGLGAAGVGVVGLGVATALYFSARSQRDDAHCLENICEDAASADKLRDAARTGNLATGFAIAGGVLVVGGLATFFLAPRTSSATAIRLEAAPSHAAIKLGGRW